MYTNTKLKPLSELSKPKTYFSSVVVKHKTKLKQWRHIGSLAPPHAASSDHLSLRHSLSFLHRNHHPQPRLRIPNSSTHSLGFRICFPIMKMVLITSKSPRKIYHPSHISDLEELLGYRPLQESRTAQRKVTDSTVVTTTTRRRMLRKFVRGLTYICRGEFSLMLNLPVSINPLEHGCSLGLVCGQLH